MIIKKNKQREVKQLKKQAEVPVSSVENITREETPDNPHQTVTEQEPEIDLFDIENIDFNQREERRRGTRRRGYRRIDDRNLVSRAQEEAENIKKSAFEEGYRKGLEKASGDIEQFRQNLINFMGAPKEVFE